MYDVPVSYLIGDVYKTSLIIIGLVLVEFCFLVPELI